MKLLAIHEMITAPIEQAFEDKTKDIDPKDVVSVTVVQTEWGRVVYLVLK